MVTTGVRVFLQFTMTYFFNFQMQDTPETNCTCSRLSPIYIGK